MRSISLALHLALVIIACTFARELYAENKTTHLVSVGSYEDKAKEIDALIEDHKQLKKDYKERFFVNPELTPLEKLQKIEEHCDTVIEAAQNEKAALLQIAGFHRNSADEF